MSVSGKEVIQVLLEFGAVVERASVDEAYVDLTRYGKRKLESAIFCSVVIIILSL
jgi:nucleotidyltransferase/DNA polymerase involved in DNA repair